MSTADDSAQKSVTPRVSAANVRTARAAVQSRLNKTEYLVKEASRDGFVIREEGAWSYNSVDGVKRRTGSECATLYYNGCDTCGFGDECFFTWPPDILQVQPEASDD